MQYPLNTIDQLKPLLQGFRKKAGFTQADMAEKLGITQQSYAQMESNVGATSVERLYTILRLLNVELLLAPITDQAGAFTSGPRYAVAQDARSPYGPAASAPAGAPGPAEPQAVKQTDNTSW
jgi:HTH-type transcriptional regulator/antitoxin HipB